MWSKCDQQLLPLYLIEVYKNSTAKSIDEFEKKLISEEIFRDRVIVKKQRDLRKLGD